MLVFTHVVRLMNSSFWCSNRKWRGCKELGSKVMRTDEVYFQDKLVSLEKKVYVL